jgi:hypothetical protein
MNANELIRLPDPKKNVRAEVAEVLKDVKGRPHVFARIKLTGWDFPQRALEPFMLVGKLVSQHVEIAPDGQTAQGYFAAPLPTARRLSFGYGKVIQWDFDLAIEPERMLRLDRSRLPKETIDPFRKRP